MGEINGQKIPDNKNKLSCSSSKRLFLLQRLHQKLFEGYETI